MVKWLKGKWLNIVLLGAKRWHYYYYYYYYYRY